MTLPTILPGGEDALQQDTDQGRRSLHPGYCYSDSNSTRSLQYSWASLVAQLVKNRPAMLETWIRSLGWEDLLEKGKAIPSSSPA